MAFLSVFAAIADDVYGVMVALGLLLGLGSTAMTIFVTRWEHRDMTERVSRLERFVDALRKPD